MLKNNYDLTGGGIGVNEKVLHVWELYMAGQFAEPHRFITSADESSVKSYVVAAQGVNSKNLTLSNIEYFTEGTADHFIRPGFWKRNLRRAYSPIFWSKYNRFCKKVANQVKPDLIHAHFGTTAARILPLLNRQRVPAVVSFYGFDASASLRSIRWKRNYLKMLKHYDRIIVLCPEVRDRLVKVLKCDPSKFLIWMLPGGIEDYPYQPREIKKHVRFITGARFVEKKGHRFLLEAFRGFLNDYPDASLTLVGYGPFRKSIEEMIVAMNLQDHVRLIDTEVKPNFPQLYYKELLESDICIQPSITASSGDDEAGPALSMVCAQASGLPVICTQFVGVSLSMKEGETGYYCKESDSADLLAKMKLLVSQPEQRLAMGKRGSELVQEEFSMKGQIRKLEQIYAEIAKIRH